jgi:hypothetical protein
MREIYDRILGVLVLTFYLAVGLILLLVPLLF